MSESKCWTLTKGYFPIDKILYPLRRGATAFYCRNFSQLHHSPLLGQGAELSEVVAIIHMHICVGFF